MTKLFFIMLLGQILCYAAVIWLLVIKVWPAVRAFLIANGVKGL